MTLIYGSQLKEKEINQTDSEHVVVGVGSCYSLLLLMEAIVWVCLGIFGHILNITIMTQGWQLANLCRRSNTLLQIRCLGKQHEMASSDLKACG